jgi:hypothetical protein
MSVHYCQCGAKFPQHLPTCPKCGGDPSTPPVLPSPPASSPPKSPAAGFIPAKAPAQKISREEYKRSIKGSAREMVARIVLPELFDDKK